MLIVKGVEIGLSNELVTDAASNQLQTVNRSPAKNSITFTDPQHAMAEVTRVIIFGIPKRLYSTLDCSKLESTAWCGWSTSERLVRCR